uniref:Uncharacterized protein LOC104239262 n=1 Tax=Nicotiana sylvestris TaxID=4096 RepID=A0A1U7XR97_NICSY|nr:PREDICTED: uncharacterized protein LOC104239262 [Nicotiana sylvestris]
MMSRLIKARLSLSRFSSMTSSRNLLFLSTESNKTDEPFRVEEAETVNVPPPPTEKLLVLGGNGFVGSHVCKEALDRGLTVASLSRKEDKEKLYFGSLVAKLFVFLLYVELLAWLSSTLYVFLIDHFKAEVSTEATHGEQSKADNFALQLWILHNLFRELKLRL